jgi:hypothetical protein
MGDGPPIASAILTIFFMILLIPIFDVITDGMHWESTYVEYKDTFLLGEYISGYDLSRISNGTFLARKVTFFGGIADITIPLEAGTTFNLGGRDYTLVDHSPSWIKVSWMKIEGGEWVKDE